MTWATFGIDCVVAAVIVVALAIRDKRWYERHGRQLDEMFRARHESGGEKGQ